MQLLNVNKINIAQKNFTMKKLVYYLLIISLVLDLIFPSTQTVNTMIPLVMAGVAAASSIYGAAKSSKETKKNQAILGGMQSDAQKEYLRGYYRDALNNPSSRSYLKVLDRSMRDNTRSTENTAAATGATQENVLAAKERNNRIQSDAIGGLIQGQEQRKDAYSDRYLQRKQALAQGEMGMNQQVAQNWNTMGSNISNAAVSLAAAYLMDGKGSMFKKITPDAP